MKPSATQYTSTHLYRTDHGQITRVAQEFQSEGAQYLEYQDLLIASGSYERILALV